MSFIRSFWRGRSRHTKLYDEWALAQTQTLEMETQSDEMTFRVKYLGSTLVESAASEADTADAVKVILNLVKAAGKKINRVVLTVNTNGIKVTDSSSEELLLEVSIYRISYCSADAANSQVFAFIATNANETLECHAFLCQKRKIAQTVSLTVAHMFNTAFQAWQLSQELADSQNNVLPKKSEIQEDSSETNGLLIDLDSVTTRNNTSSSSSSSWVNFDNDNYFENFDNGHLFNKNFNAMPQPLFS